MFPMRSEVAENRARKGLAANRTFVPEDKRYSCLKCGGLAREYNGGSAESRECLECGFMWDIRDGSLLYGVKDMKWHEVPFGLLPIWWEKEFEEV